MQIFIPYPTFDDSVKCLDKRRLQKQNLETTQILDAILNLPTKSGKERKGWLNHPALVMWKNHPGALTDYLERGIVECNARGIKTDYVQDRLNLYRSLNACQDRTLPIWWGDIKVHNSHKSRLLQKGFEELFKKQKTAQNTIEWYANFNWDEMKDPNLFLKEYLWAENITSESYDLKVRVSKDTFNNKQKIIKEYGTNPFFSGISQLPHPQGMGLPTRSL